MQLLALQARAMDGTRPSIVTRALSTKIPKGRPRGDPCTTAQGRCCSLPLDSMHDSREGALLFSATSQHTAVPSADSSALHKPDPESQPSQRNRLVL